MELLCGPIEVTPECGSDEEADFVSGVGDPKVDIEGECLDRPLVCGERILVTVPWRVASSIDLLAGRVPLCARFFKALDNT